MQMTTVQWNIGGGKILQSGLDPTTILSYTEDGIEHIISCLRSVNPDIITLQEVHKNDTVNQAEYIAKQIGMEYCISDFYADSHLEKDQKLGHAIISKFPITDKEFQLYINPHKKIIGEDGITTWHSHDKGYTRCAINVNGVTLQTTTTHFAPFRRFDIAIYSDEGRRILDDIEEKLTTDAKHQLIQADFNLDMPRLGPALPHLIKDRLEEVEQTEATTPKDRRYDHILFRGMTLLGSNTNSQVLTDHYPVTAVFEITE